MEKIRKILQTKSYQTMSDNEMEKIALEEFPRFEDDCLKIQYLVKLFSRHPEKLSMSPEECSRLLVESGTYEGGQ